MPADIVDQGIHELISKLEFTPIKVQYKWPENTVVYTGFSKYFNEVDRCCPGAKCSSPEECFDTPKQYEISELEARVHDYLVPDWRKMLSRLSGAEIN